MVMNSPRNSASPPAGDAAVRRPRRIAEQVSRLVTAAALIVALVGCGSGSAKDYDIGPVFPLSQGKCAKYDGNAEGSGPFAKCWVTKEQCKRAAADWAESMGNVPDAIRFRC